MLEYLKFYMYRKLEPLEGIHKVFAKVCWLKLSRDAWRG